MSWWFERDAFRSPPGDPRPPITVSTPVPDDLSIADFEASLALERERKAARRAETWLFVRATLVLLFVIGVVILRQALFI